MRSSLVFVLPALVACSNPPTPLDSRSTISTMRPPRLESAVAAIRPSTKKSPATSRFTNEMPMMIPRVQARLRVHDLAPLSKSRRAS
jgi:hypothetical protein